MTLLLVLLVAGCETARDCSLTYKLWDKGSRPSCRPSMEPNLAVFTSTAQPDVLVAYNALDTRAGRILRRAYFLHTNEARIAMRQKPLYVEPSIATNMISASVIATTNNVPQTGVFVRYPISTNSGSSFELYRNGQSEGTHDLPIYNEERHPAARVALTPVAILGDTLMVGVAVALAGASGR
jgi:hypothetical protein